MSCFIITVRKLKCLTCHPDNLDTTENPVLVKKHIKTYKGYEPEFRFFFRDLLFKNNFMSYTEEDN